MLPVSTLQNSMLDSGWAWSADFAIMRGERRGETTFCGLTTPIGLRLSATSKMWVLVFFLRGTIGKHSTGSGCGRFTGWARRFLVTGIDGLLRTVSSQAPVRERVEASFLLARVALLVTTEDWLTSSRFRVGRLEVECASSEEIVGWSSSLDKARRLETSVDGLTISKFRLDRLAVATILGAVFVLLKSWLNSSDCAPPKIEEKKSEILETYSHFNTSLTNIE